MNTKEPIILGIESSCDDTSAAILSEGKILANVIANQKVHAQYGGVVPELASRAHQRNIVPTVTVALENAGIQLSDLDAVAYTQGPGLLGSLLVGVSYAKSLAYSLDIPSIAVDHMKGHVLSHFIAKPGEAHVAPEFPYLSLIVSGGHTQLVMVNSPHDMEILGKTIDDAVGEAFDKTAKMLGMPYPGGPLVDKAAQRGQVKFEFNKPRVDGLDMSFSGLKTSILYFLKKQVKEDEGFLSKNIDDICASVQATIIEILMEKLRKAIVQYRPKHVGLAGGVAANSGLRAALISLGEELDIQIHIPAFEYCTDNAAMIAMTGHFDYLAGKRSELSVTPTSNLSF